MIILMLCVTVSGGASCRIMGLKGIICNCRQLGSSVGCSNVGCLYHCDWLNIQWIYNSEYTIVNIQWIYNKWWIAWTRFRVQQNCRLSKVTFCLFILWLSTAHLCWASKKLLSHPQSMTLGAPSWSQFSVQHHRCCWGQALTGLGFLHHS